MDLSIENLTRDSTIKKVLIVVGLGVLMVTFYNTFLQIQLNKRNLIRADESDTNEIDLSD